MKDVDYSELKINIAKFRADGDRYFSLFDKHIPTGLGTEARILVYKIGNVDAIARIIDKNPAAVHYICDRECVNKLIHIARPCAKIKDLPVDHQEKYDIFEDKDMKFDLIIMNPPYERDLHLKILSKALDFLKNNNSVCVCLHPSNWIRRFDYWKTKEKIPVKDCLFLTVEESSMIFSAVIGSHLAITVATKDGSCDYQKWSKFIPWVKDKIIDYAKWLFNNKECPGRTQDPNEKFILNFPIIHGHFGKLDQLEITSKKYDIALKVKFGKRKQDINSFAFNSEIERKNFYNSLFTDFYKFLIISCRNAHDATRCYFALPWLGEDVNPRTGLKGYAGEWTNDDLCSYFKLTEDEKRQIEETVADYVKSCK